MLYTYTVDEQNVQEASNCLWGEELNGWGKDFTTSSELFDLQTMLLYFLVLT